MSKFSLVSEADGKGVRETASRKRLRMSLAQRMEDMWPIFGQEILNESQRLLGRHMPLIFDSRDEKLVSEQQVQ